MNNKLVLGTVQFGCQYGINSAGRPDEKTVLEILDLAYHSGITNLDTSSAYGNAEYILGKVLSASDSSFQIISKYPESGKSVATVLDQINRFTRIFCLWVFTSSFQSLPE